MILTKDLQIFRSAENLLEKTYNLYNNIRQDFRRTGLVRMENYASDILEYILEMNKE